jgi:anionic cell wall polymer biosynthesis LytR-Cps2A-Psr (LCP) family protein
MTTYADPRTRPRGRGPAKRTHRRPRKPRDPLWAKICLIIGSMVMMVSGIAIVGPKVLASWATRGIPKADLIPPEARGTNIDGAINILLLGMDERSGVTTEPIRADTIIVVHIPKTHDRVYMVSIPRDAEVDIPDFPETNFKGYRTKVNAAFAAGARKDGKPDDSAAGRSRGAKLTIQTLNNLVPGGLKFNGVAIINFAGFKKILTALEGVNLCVDVETRSIQFDKAGIYHTHEVPYNDRKVYPVGCRNFTASEALDYSRQRHFDNGDYTRQRHQQQLLMAIFKKLVSKGTLTDIGKITELQKAAGDLLTLDLGGQAVENWIFTLKALRPADVVMIKTNGGSYSPLGNGNERLTPDTMDLLKAVHDDAVFEFLTKHPTWIAPEK